MPTNSNELEELMIKKLIAKYNSISNEVNTLRERGKIIYPKENEVLNAFSYFNSFNDIKVVIIGQDPYHGPGQAHGFSFSVPKGVPMPPSLKNIFIELNDDLKIAPPAHGCLENWAKQGVLLLNRILTVEESKPKSHEGLGWVEYTEELIKFIDKFCFEVVFLLWGREAKKVENIILNPTHQVLTASHPSPLSARRGFFGCRHFSKTNEILKSTGQTPINWST